MKPIRTEQDYDTALQEIREILDAPSGTSEVDRLETLTTLVEAYEQEHHPIPPPDPVDALLYYLESRGLSEADLVPFIGSRKRVAEVLGRRHALTLGMIRRLHSGLRLPADILIQPYALTSSG
jgi:HTH-type transcriptional regulator/antitoxin HigA